MSGIREVVVLSGVRTAVGGYGGSLKDHPPSELAAVCVREAVSRAGVEPREAENVAKKYGTSREAQDKLAAESHKRAANAIDKGYFKGQILPVEVKVKGGTVPFEVDETVRRDSTAEKLARLKPVFDPAGTVTAGNASSINDAAAAVVLMERGQAKKRGLQPLGRLVAYSYAGVDPKFMGIGPVPAVKALFKKTGFGLKDIDVFEVNA